MAKTEDCCTADGVLDAAGDCWRRLRLRRLLRCGPVFVPFCLSGSRQLGVTSLAARFLDLAVIDRLLKKALGAGFIEAQTLSEFAEGRQICGQRRVAKRQVRADSVENRYGWRGRRHVRDCRLRWAPSQPQAPPSSASPGLGRRPPPRSARPPVACDRCALMILASPADRSSSLFAGGLGEHSSAVRPPMSAASHAPSTRLVGVSARRGQTNHPSVARHHPASPDQSCPEGARRRCRRVGLRTLGSRCHGLAQSGPRGT